jgi:hypothetical protein
MSDTNRSGLYSGIYEAIADQAVERVAFNLNPAAFSRWLADQDTGGDPDWYAIDDAIDRLIGRYKAMLDE